MTVRLDDRVIHLEGDCHVEDAEPLLHLLQTEPNRTVDISAVGAIHTAVLQLLLALRPRVVGRPKLGGSDRDDFFECWITPLLVTPRNE
jgi:hypothetical protein